MNKADFTVDGDRAAQLLKKNGTKNTRVDWKKYTSDNSAQLGLNDVNYDGDIVLSDVEFLLFRVFGKNQLGRLGETSDARHTVTMHSTVWDTKNGSLKIYDNVKADSITLYGYNEEQTEVLFGGDLSVNEQIIIDDEGYLNITGTIKKLPKLQVGHGIVNINGTVNNLDNLVINGGTVTITGDSVPNALANLTMNESEV